MRPGAALALTGLALLVALVMSAGFVTLQALALQIDPAPIGDNLRRGFARAPLLFPGGPYRYNNCLISGMAYARQGEPLSLMLSPPRIVGTMPPANVCIGLRAMVVDGGLDPETHRLVPYHQYLHGHRALFGALLAVAGPERIVAGFRWVAGAAMLAALAALAWKVAARRGQAPWLAYAVHVALFVLLYDLWTAAGSFARFPTDMLLVAFLVGGLAVDVTRLRPGRRTAGFAALGVVVAFLELLHGAIPLFAAAVVLLVFVQAAAAGIAPLRLAVSCIAAFAVALAACLALKVALVTVLFEPGYPGRYLDLLAYRITGAPPAPGVDATSAALGRLYDKLRHAHPLFAHGVPGLGQVIYILAGLGHLFGLALLARRGDPATRRALAGLLLSSAAIGAWFLVFRAHTIQHPFMLTLLAWPLAAGGAMLVAVGQALITRRQLAAARPVPRGMSDISG